MKCQNTAMWVCGAGIKICYFFVQKHIAPLAMCYNSLLVRDKPLGPPASVNSSIALNQAHLQSIPRFESMPLGCYFSSMPYLHGGYAGFHL